MVGGDGTINEVLNGITDYDRVRLGVIPSGSGNDFAKNLCLPFLVAAKHEKIRGFSTIHMEKLVLKADKPMVLHADGEYCGDVTEAEFVCRKGCLKLLR